MNWMQLVDSMSIICLGATAILQSIQMKRYSDMAWELDEALTRLEGDVRNLENPKDFQ